MTRNRQKTEERLCATRAMEIIGIEWGIKEPQNETEWPDLVISAGNQTFGLEVRKLYADEGSSGSPRRTNESRWAKVLQDAAVAYYQISSLAVRVQFYGDPGKPTELAKLISKTVPFLHPWENKKICLGSQRWMYIRRLPDECRRYRRWDIVSDSVGWVGHIDSKIVQNTIDVKSANLRRYRTHLESVSLLLVCDRIKNSGKHLFENTESSLNTAGFDCVYLLSFPDQLVAVSAQQGAPSDRYSASAS